MIISFVASIMFNMNNYLLMFCCIAFCLICSILLIIEILISIKLYKLILTEKECTSLG